jgi:cupin fold WbuC family metalloprotein
MHTEQPKNLPPSFLGLALPVLISSAKVNELKLMALNSVRGRARFLLHAGHDDPVQEMMIAICSRSYVMPHRFPNRHKTYFEVSGQFHLVFFDDNGTVTETVLMGNGPDMIKMCRFSTDRWHTVVSHDDVSVYGEIIQGPFLGNEWADWAPKEEVGERAQRFLAELKASLQNT